MALLMKGLSSAEAADQLKQHGANRLQPASNGRWKGANNGFTNA